MPNSWPRARYRSGARVARKETTPTAQGSCICPVALSIGSSTSTGSTRSPMNNWASPRGTKMRLTTTPGASHNPRGGPDSNYSLSGKVADHLTYAPSLPIRCFPVTRRSMRLTCLVTPKVWPRVEQNIWEALTFYLPLFLTESDMAKWWGLNRYTWSEFVDKREAQEGCSRTKILATHRVVPVDDGTRGDPSKSFRNWPRRSGKLREAEGEGGQEYGHRMWRGCPLEKEGIGRNIGQVQVLVAGRRVGSSAGELIVGDKNGMWRTRTIQRKPRSGTLVSGLRFDDRRLAVETQRRRS